MYNAMAMNYSHKILFATQNNILCVIGYKISNGPPSAVLNTAEGGPIGILKTIQMVSDLNEMIEKAQSIKSKKTSEIHIST